MSTLAGGSGEQNNAVIGGKDQLKLDEDTRACLSPSPWSGGPRLAKPPQRDRPCSPRSGGLGWLARLLLAALEHASVCTRGHADAQVQLGAWGERRSRFRPPDPTGRLRLQDSRDGPQATELSLSPPPCRWGWCGPKTRMMPRVCSTPKGGCRKRAELHGPSLSPLAPSAAPSGASSPPGTLGTKCMLPERGPCPKAQSDNSEASGTCGR